MRQSAGTGPAGRISALIWRPVTRGLDHGVRAEAGGLCGAGHPQMGGEQVVDLPGQPDPAAADQQQVVAGVLQLGDDVRGHHDGGAVLGGLRHQRAHQLVPGQRVEVGHRLVQEQQFGPLAEGEGEGDPGALAAGEGADAGLRVQVAARDDPLGAGRVPAPGVEVGAHAQRLGDGELRVQRLVLGDEADPGAGGGRGGAEDGHAAPRWRR